MPYSDLSCILFHFPVFNSLVDRQWINPVDQETLGSLVQHHTTSTWRNRDSKSGLNTQLCALGHSFNSLWIAVSWVFYFMTRRGEKRLTPLLLESGTSWSETSLAWVYRVQMVHLNKNEIKCLSWDDRPGLWLLPCQPTTSVAFKAWAPKFLYTSSVQPSSSSYSWVGIRNGQYDTGNRSPSPWEI